MIIDLESDELFARSRNSVLKTVLLEIVADRDRSSLDRSAAGRARAKCKETKLASHVSMVYPDRGARKFVWLPANTLTLKYAGYSLTRADAEQMLKRPDDPNVTAGFTRPNIDYQGIVADFRQWKLILSYLQSTGADGRGKSVRRVPCKGVETFLVAESVSRTTTVVDADKELAEQLGASGLEQAAGYVTGLRSLLRSKEIVAKGDARTKPVLMQTPVQATSVSLVALDAHVEALGYIRALKRTYLSHETLTDGQAEHLLHLLAKALCFAAIGQRFDHAFEVATQLPTTWIEIMTKFPDPMREPKIDNCLRWFFELSRIKGVGKHLRAALVFRIMVSLRRIKESRHPRIMDALVGYVVERTGDCEASIPKDIILLEAARFACVFGVSEILPNVVPNRTSPVWLVDYHLFQAVAALRTAIASGSPQRVAAATKVKKMLSESATRYWTTRTADFMNGAKLPPMDGAIAPLESEIPQE